MEAELAKVDAENKQTGKDAKKRRSSMNKTTAKKVEVRDEEAKKVRAAKRETFRRVELRADWGWYLVGKLNTEPPSAPRPRPLQVEAA